MVLASHIPQVDTPTHADLLIRSGGVTARGRSRTANEDGLHLDSRNRFFIVTDGMGGERAGDVASAMAIRTLAQRLQTQCEDDSGFEVYDRWLADALYDTNDLLLAAKGNDERLSGMGATAVIAAIEGRRLYVAGLGDSRAYLIRGNSIAQLTTDHSVAQSMVDAGLVGIESLKSHPFRNILHQYLGCSELGEGPCIAVLPLQPGDRILLATDGLTDRVENELLANIVNRHNDPQVAARHLLQTAVKSGATDDVTCAAVFIELEANTVVDSQDWANSRSAMM